MAPIVVDFGKVHELVDPESFYLWFSRHQVSEDEVWTTLAAEASTLVAGITRLASARLDA